MHLVTVLKGLERRWKELKMTVIPIVIDAFGTVCKRGGKRTERIENTVIPIVIDAFGTVLKGVERETERTENDGDTNSNRRIWDGPLSGWKEDGKN